MGAPGGRCGGGGGGATSCLAGVPEMAALGEIDELHIFGVSLMGFWQAPALLARKIMIVDSRAETDLVK